MINRFIWWLENEHFKFWSRCSTFNTAWRVCVCVYGHAARWAHEKFSTCREKITRVILNMDANHVLQYKHRHQHHQKTTLLQGKNMQLVSHTNTFLFTILTYSITHSFANKYQFQLTSFEKLARCTTIPMKNHQ